jgi:hypothetical protein
VEQVVRGNTALIVACEEDACFAGPVVMAPQLQYLWTKLGQSLSRTCLS